MEVMKNWFLKICVFKWVKLCRYAGEDADVRTSRDVDLGGNEHDEYGGGDDMGLGGLQLESTGMEDPD
jgi:hypothetical protein